MERFIFDSHGKQTGVLISVSEWNEFQKLKSENIKKTNSNKMSSLLKGSLSDINYEKINAEIVNSRNEWERNI